jgi:hypothetical protein
MIGVLTRPAAPTTLIDSGTIEAALVALLNADPVLVTLLPDGVYEDWAADNGDAFAVVRLLTERDLAAFGRRVGEDYRFLVLVSTLEADIADAAARRIEALLDDGTLEVPGCTVQAMYTEARVSDDEPDGVTPGLTWQHRGGQYRVQVALHAGDRTQTG